MQLWQSPQQPPGGHHAPWPAPTRTLPPRLRLQLAPEHLCNAGHWAGSRCEREVKSFHLQEVMSVDVLTGLGVQGQRDPDPPGGSIVQPGGGQGSGSKDGSFLRSMI